MKWPEGDQVTLSFCPRSLRCQTHWTPSQLRQLHHSFCKPLPQKHWNSSGLVPAISEKSEFFRSNVRVLLFHFVCFGGRGRVHFFTVLFLVLVLMGTVLGLPLRCPGRVGSKCITFAFCSDTSLTQGERAFSQLKGEA